MRAFSTVGPLHVAMVALAVACSNTPSPGGGSTPADGGPQVQSGSLGDTLHIPLGRSVSVDGGRLIVTFVAHGTDSRCPANVVCVWMGDIPVRILARSGNMTVERELHTGFEPRALTAGPYVVRVSGVLPYPGTETPGTPSPTKTVLVTVEPG